MERGNDIMTADILKTIQEGAVFCASDEANVNYATDIQNAVNSIRRTIFGNNKRSNR